MVKEEASSQVTWTKAAGVATLMINHPPVNALSSRVINEINGCLEEIAADPGVVVLVVTGTGEKFFVAGADIKEFPEMLKMSPEAVRDYARRTHYVFNALDFFPKPTIAAVNGLALGGGCELMLACDLRIASANVRLGLPEIKLGLFPGGGGTQRLARSIGVAKAKELMFTGEPITADEALRIGLINKAVPAGQALDAAQDLARIIAQRAGVALAYIKQAVGHGLELSLRDGLDVEIELFGMVFQTEDAREGVTAFLEKRQPLFRHC